ncbi:MAG: hypothetical protein J6V93_02780 [Clostridia bacterium]|nr:hypothetical protein [Clostridia bacterium]
MKQELVSTVIGAAVVEYICAFILPKSNGALAKYLRYLLALVLVISIITPMLSVWGENTASLTDALDKIKLNEASVLNYKYVYIKNSVAYKADDGGNRISDKPVPCDMYLLEVVRSMTEEINKKLCLRFGRGADIGVSLDISNMENIEITSLWVSDVEGYIASDIKSYLENELGIKVCVE